MTFCVALQCSCYHPRGKAFSGTCLSVCNMVTFLSLHLDVSFFGIIIIKRNI